MTSSFSPVSSLIDLISHKLRFGDGPSTLQLPFSSSRLSAGVMVWEKKVSAVAWRKVTSSRMSEVTDVNRAKMGAEVRREKVEVRSARVVLTMVRCVTSAAGVGQRAAIGPGSPALTLGVGKVGERVDRCAADDEGSHGWSSSEEGWKRSSDVPLHVVAGSGAIQRDLVDESRKPLALPQRLAQFPKLSGCSDDRIGVETLLGPRTCCSR